MSRNISCLIKLSWTEDEVMKRAETMARLINENLG
jgi:8-amino-3,8-dideoxy-alpha-D-manno-octulosonate transaminase